MKIEEFKEATERGKVSCVFCGGRTNVKIFTHEYILADTVLKLVYHCLDCEIIYTVSAY